MKILVTGGAGFLGSHLISRLIELEHEVVCLDNLYTGRMQNIVEFRKNRNFKFIQQDVQEPINVEVDGIFNLACPASPVHYQKDPVRTLRTNVQGAINVLELAHRQNARVLQASTSEVYGDPSVSPQSEEYWGNVNPIGIRSCYDEGKRAAETLFSDYNRQLETDVRIARIFNTYGPSMSFDDGRVVSNLICQAILGKPLTIYGDGSQTRSFCFVSDLIEGILALFFKEGIYTPVNLGNPNPITMTELARTVLELTESNSELVFEKLPSDDPLMREPDISLAKSELNWNPSVNLRDGLIQTIAYFKSELAQK
jgi:UDP-glucuronate decarboxylase